MVFVFNASVMCIATALVFPVQEKYVTSILGVSAELVMFNSSCVVDVVVFVSVLAELQADENRIIINKIFNFLIYYPYLTNSEYIIYYKP